MCTVRAGQGGKIQYERVVGRIGQKKLADARL